MALVGMFDFPRLWQEASWSKLMAPSLQPSNFNAKKVVPEALSWGGEGLCSRMLVVENLAPHAAADEGYGQP